MLRFHDLANLTALTFATLAFAASGAGAELSKKSASSAYTPGAAAPFQVLHTFTGGVQGYGLNGVTPDSSGNLFGTAEGSNGCPNQCGNVFSLTRPRPGSSIWTFGTVYNFSQLAPPSSPPTIQGNTIYGSTAGSTIVGGPTTFGSVYRLVHSSSGWTYKVLHTFNGTDGFDPGAILAAADGTLYGAAGTNSGGILFKITPAGVFSVLVNFGHDNGSGPNGNITFGPDGAIYGTTDAGGKFKNGTIFRVTTAAVYQLLYSFDSGQPYGIQLAIGRDGTLYGVNGDGGRYNRGLVWSLTPATSKPWTFTDIFDFGPTKYRYPVSIKGVTRDEAGNLYVIYPTYNDTNFTEIGGVLFRLAPPKTGTTWTLQRLHVFSDPHGISFGASPSIFYGVLYGVTSENSSTVWSYRLY